MNTAEQNYRLFQEIEASRMFLLMACQQNPKLLEHADARIRLMFEVPMSQNHSIPQPIPFGVGKQRGASLVELILFIVIISIALAGILLVMNNVTGRSADTLIRKQALAVAESLLEEIALQDFISASGVTNAVTPANRATEYHIINDYAGFATTGIFSITNVEVTGLRSYNAAVAVVPAALGAIAAGSAVQITVTVTDPQKNPVQVSGYRTAY